MLIAFGNEHLKTDVFLHEGVPKSNITVHLNDICENKERNKKLLQDPGLNILNVKFRAVQKVDSVHISKCSGIL